MVCKALLLSQAKESQQSSREEPETALLTKAMARRI